jgi:hypothetical protein
MNNLAVVDFVDEKQLTTIKDEIGSVGLKFIVNNAETAIMADNRVAQADLALKAIEEKLGPAKQKAHELHKKLSDLMNEMAAPWKADRTYFVAEMKRFQREEKEKAEAEERRLREIARKELEERQLQDAVEAEVNGDLEEAQAIIEEEMFVPTPIVRPDVPKVDGRRYATKWSWKVTDINKVPREYLIVDQIKMNGIVRAMKGQTRISGIEVFEE